MVVCRKAQNGDAAAGNGHGPENGETKLRIGQGGPVFVPRRKPSPMAETLLMGLPYEVDRVTAYDEEWFLGRPRV